MTEDPLMSNSMDTLHSTYFEIIEDHYGRYLKDDDPFKSINKLLKMPLTSKIIYQTSDDVLQEITKLLSRNFRKIERNIKSLNGINCIFSGNITSQNAKNFLCKSGLYVDTVIMPDPFVILQYSKSGVTKDHFSESLFRHSFHHLLYLVVSLFNHYTFASEVDLTSL